MRIFRSLLPLVVAFFAIAVPATVSAQVYVSFNAPPPVNYGYGYYGNGYNGGNWNGNQFRYNTAVSNVNPTVVRNVYVDRTVIVRNVNYTSYNGGNGGPRATPTAREQALANQHRYAATTAQRERVSDAADNHSNLETTIHSKPVQPAHKAEPAAKLVHQAAPAAKPQHQAAPKPPQQKPADKPAKPDEKNPPA